LDLIVHNRAMLGAAPYLRSEWAHALGMVGLGGTIVFLSALCYFLNVALTLAVSRAPALDMPASAEAMSGPEHAPAFLDRWRPWLALAGLLIVVAYGPVLVRLALTTPLNAPVW
jgi:cytochrome c oxidase subunit 1